MQVSIYYPHSSYMRSCSCSMLLRCIKCFTATLFSIAALVMVGCATKASPGPDKAVIGTFEGAATGAGAGAITGFQLSSVTGPGVAVGAGFGAVAGGIQGLIQDKNEEHDLKLAAELKKERERAYVHAILEEHYKRRLELHPTRDIYPADLFFLGDQANLKKESHALVEEIARLNKERFPWSRLVIACYAKSIDPESEFTQTLCERRSRDIADNLVRGGLEPRRLVTRSVIIDSPLLVDPLDQDAGRYNQAIEIIPIDR